jgi:hypothetical protein
MRVWPFLTELQPSQVIGLLGHLANDQFGKKNFFQNFYLICMWPDRGSKVVYTIKFLWILNEYLWRNANFSVRPIFTYIIVFFENFASNCEIIVHQKKNLFWPKDAPSNSECTKRDGISILH